MHDVFAAAIHQARTGEARNWWSFTPQRKARQQDGSFPVYSPGL
nr:helix-hairpin-helix domain-containing protein [Acetobacter persici]